MNRTNKTIGRSLSLGSELH